MPTPQRGSDRRRGPTTRYAPLPAPPAEFEIVSGKSLVGTAERKWVGALTVKPAATE